MRAWDVLPVTSRKSERDFVPVVRESNIWIFNLDE
jgi:hypothetical protein